MEDDAYLQMAAAEATHWWFRGRRRILVAEIRRLQLPANAKILEVGSGTGGNLAMLSQFGMVTAVELNDMARAISISKTGARHDIRAGRLPDGLPLAGQQFDLICLFDVLEHVEQDEETLATIHRHLASGGYALITVPAFSWLWGPHDVALHHKRRYEKADLANKLRATGFVMERLSYVNMLLFPLAVLMRVYDRARGRSSASGTQTPPWLLNEIFTVLFGAEAFFLRVANLPFGLSLLAVVKAA